jgi:hypothetical protein
MANVTHQNSPVFPVPDTLQLRGLTIREFMASMALQAIITHRSAGSSILPEDAAKEAINYADALLQALSPH